jgi:EAL domain-containing protein (putative c-di-GMP-specific phosphodiesterase class I)
MSVAGPSVLGARVDVPEPDTDVVQLLGVLRRQLGMELAWLGRLEDDGLVLQVLNGDAAAFGVGPGSTLAGPGGDRERTIFWNVLTGQLPPIIPDTRADALTAGLPTVDELHVGAFAGAPIHDGGRVYGMTGCVGYPLEADVDAVHRQILTLVADLLSASVRDLHRMWERSRRNWRAVRRILDAGGPGVAFQPVVDLRTGATVGVEALARFPAPPADPHRWFARAATVGLDVELELAAVRQALKVLPEIPAGASLAVNVSPKVLTNGLLDVLARLEDGVDLTRLVVEVTEQEHWIDDLMVLRAARDLRARGARLAADDVGAGYSGLHRLVHLQPEVIKMDRCLVHGIDDDPVRRATASALMQIADTIGSRVIAEGIETSAELAAVRDTGIVYGQGFRLARPAFTLPPFHRGPRAPGITRAG